MVRWSEASEIVRKSGGLTAHPETGVSPASGFMVARPEYGVIVTATSFYDSITGAQILSDYLTDNQGNLTSTDYLGLWHDTARDEVAIDIAENIQDKDEAIRAGIARNQQSIWDIINEVEITTGGTGR